MASNQWWIKMHLPIWWTNSLQEIQCKCKKLKDSDLSNKWTCKIWTWWNNSIIICSTCKWWNKNSWKWVSISKCLSIKYLTTSRLISTNCGIHLLSKYLTSKLKNQIKNKLTLISSNNHGWIQVIKCLFTKIINLIWIRWTNKIFSRIFSIKRKWRVKKLKVKNKRKKMTYMELPIIWLMY